MKITRRMVVSRSMSGLMAAMAVGFLGGTVWAQVVKSQAADREAFEARGMIIQQLQEAEIRFPGLR